VKLTGVLILNNHLCPPQLPYFCFPALRISVTHFGILRRQGYLYTPLLLGLGWRTGNKICITVPGPGNRIGVSKYYIGPSAAAADAAAHFYTHCLQLWYDFAYSAVDFVGCVGFR